MLGSIGAQTLASSAATQMVTGNIALDNQSYDNLTANKFSSLMKTDIGAMPTSSYGAGTSINEEDSLGGLSVLKNGGRDMHAKQVTQQITRTEYSADTQSATDQKSLSHTAELSQSASSSAEAVNRMASRLHAGVKGGAIAGAASVYLQKVLADKNYHAVDNATLNQVADDVQLATLASADAANAQVQGHPQQAESFVQKSQAALNHAFHALTDKLGGGTQGAVAASALLSVGLTGAVAGIAASLPEAAAAAEGAEIVQGGRVLGSYVAKAFARVTSAVGMGEEAVAGAQQTAKALLGSGKIMGAVGLGAKFLSAFNEAGEGSLSLDTEAMHSNKVDSVIATRQSRQTGEQNLASTESRVGSQITVTRTMTENLSSERPGDDYFKASDINIAAPYDSAKTMMDQKKQEIQNKTQGIQHQGDALRQKVAETLNANTQATQAKDLLDFKSTPAAKNPYKVRKDE